MTTVSSACALLLIAMFVVAAISKLTSPAQIRRSAVSLGVPAWLAPLLAPLEIAVAFTIAIRPQIGAFFASLLLLSFTFLLARVVRSGATVTCGCFGAASNAPITSTTVVRNVGLLTLIWPTVFADRLTDLSKGPTVAQSVLVAVAIFLFGSLVLALLDARRVSGAMFPRVRAEA